MILIYALLFILAEAITEGLLKRYNKLDWIFDPLLQWGNRYLPVYKTIK